MPSKLLVRHILLLSFITLLKQTNGYAQEYFVGFFGENISLHAMVGHAFIGIGKGTPLTCEINGDETLMVGFYPNVHIDGAKSWWFGPVDGAIKSDVTSKIDEYFLKKSNSLTTSK